MKFHVYLKKKKKDLAQSQLDERKSKKKKLMP